MTQDPDSKSQTRILPGATAVLSITLAIFFAVAAVIGVDLWSHPIPYWDMWDGHYAFWFQLQDGNPAIWWELSNEHHLLLLKAIFWLDLTVFSGTTTFLLAVNLILLALLAIVLILLLGQRLEEIDSRRSTRIGYVILAGLIVIIVTAWMQGEDLVIGYHAQWLLVTLLPIATFLSIGLAHRADEQGSSRGRWFFAIAVGLTVLSPWAAASGLVAPFVAAGLAFALSMTWKRTLTFVGVGVVSIAAYSIGHPLLGGSGGPLPNVFSMPIDVLKFWLLYLGGPWSRVADNQWVGGVAGVCFIVIVVTYVVRMLHSTHRSVWGLVAAAFPIFMLLMAFVTAAGRISYGLEQVSALRYLTPMLSAWACLLILAAPGLNLWFMRGSALATLSVLTIPALLLNEQVQALQTPHDMLQQKDTATLAVALSAPDLAAIGAVYPFSPDRPLMLGQRALAERFGAFKDPSYTGLISRLGTTGPLAPATSCFGWLDSRTPLENSMWDRIEGWVVVRGFRADSGVLTLTNGMGTVVGFVDMGKPRPDVLSEFPESSGLNGYYGYLDRSAVSADIFVVDGAFRCSTPLTAAIP